MKIAVVTKEGDTAAICQRLMAEGHNVKLIITKEKYSKLLDGIVDKLQGEDEVEIFSPDLIVNLETDIPGFSEQFEGKGFLVLGGSRQAIELEDKRYEALEFAHNAGINIPPTVQFHDGPSAIQWLKQHAGADRFIVKFNRDSGDKWNTYLGKTNNDTIKFIEQHEKPGGGILQQYIEGPAEVNIEIWFSKGNPIWPANGGIEQKRLMTGDMGPNTGCQSTLTWPLAAASYTPWTPELLQKLRELEYSGPLDMAFKVGDDNQFYFLEFTPRLGLNAGFGLIDLLDEDLGEFLASVAMGTANSMRLRPEYCFLYTISIPPYPYDFQKVMIKDIEVDLSGVKDGNFWAYDIYRSDDRLFHSGVYPLIGYTSAIDIDPRKAINKSRKIAEAIEVSGKQYRDDPEETLKSLKLLRQLGIIPAVPERALQQRAG